MAREQVIEHGGERMRRSGSIGVTVLEKLPPFAGLSPP